MRILVAIIGTAYLAAPGAAQPIDCRAIADPKKRLECFDRAPAPVPKAPKAKTKAADDPLIAQARAAVSKTLRDPDAARFAELKRTKFPNVKGVPTDAVCGTVNAKNAYGAYIGAKPFVYLPAGNFVRIVGEGDAADKAISQAIYKRFCLGQPD